jgi:hypothetical protein
VRRLAALAALLGLAFGGVTLAALEGRDVVVLRTVDAAGRPRETRTWVADADGAAWVEAANPERPFLRDVLTNPAVALRRDGRWRRCRAEVAPNPEGHVRIRALLAARYGWADRWIALLADTRRSSAVRLACAP